MFTIYSVGDAAFLEQIFIAVAMVTDTNSFDKMVAIGLLLGAIFIFMQSLSQGAKQIDFQQIFLGYLLYTIMFLPTTRVAIEDSYSGQVRIVDNIPIGIGAAGGIISSIGFNITNLFEQGYGAIIPYVTETHFAESLKILNDTRRRISSTPVFNALDTALGNNANLRKSWHNYIRECSLTAIDLEEKSLDEMMAGALPEAFRFESELYGTKLYLEKPGGTNYTCSEAYPPLIQATNKAVSSRHLSAELLKMLGINSHYAGTGQGYITQALGALGATSTAGTAYLTAAIIEPIYYEAAQGRYMDFQDFASATMLNQAIQQRNSQWAAEQSMFLTIVRPMMTFFEGFVFAITPLMGFLIVLGSFGIGLAARYFQTLLWIQLWMPVMSIINLYIHTAASNSLASYGSQLTSMYALDSGSDQLQHWIATGGMLASATPIIALFIVTGSTYAFTSLAGRIAGKDHINEKIPSKDLITSGPVLQALSSNEYSDVTGMASSGASGLMGSISFGTGLSGLTSSSHQSMTSAQQAFSSALGSSFSGSTMNSQTYEKAASLGRTHSAAFGETEGIVNNRANQIMQNTSLSSQHADAVKGVVTAAASGGISPDTGSSLIQQLNDKVKGKVRGNANLSTNASKASTASRNASSEERAAITNALTFDNREQSQVSNNLARAVSKAEKTSLTETLGQQETDNLTQSAQNLLSSSDIYTRADSMNQTYGSLNNLNLRDVANQVGNSAPAMKSLNAYWNYGGVNSETKMEAQRLYGMYSLPSTEGGYGFEPKAAFAASRIKALQNSGGFGVSDRQYLNNFNAALEAVGLGMGLTMGTASDFGQHADTPLVSNPGLTTAVQERTSGVNTRVAAAGGFTPDATQYPNYQEPLGSRAMPESIASEAQLNNAGITATEHLWQTQKNADAEANARQQLLNNGPEYSRMSAADFYGTVENTADWLGRRAINAEHFGQSVFNAAGQGMDMGSAAFEDQLEQLKNNSELRQEVINAAQMNDAALAESGLGGTVLSGLSGVGRSLMGAAAMGMELVQGQIGFDDLKAMALDEKGMIYQAAMSHALETGGQEALRSFEQDFGPNFREDFYAEAQSRGLTHEQAQVYAHSYDMNLMGISQERQQAIQQLASTYAEYDAQGHMLKDADGNPILNQQNQAFVDHMVDQISESTRAGSSLSGSYLTGIAHYNSSTGRI